MRRLTTIFLLCAAVTVWAQVTDWHCHAIPDSYRELVARHGASLDEGFPLPRWSEDNHLQLMDEAGIATSVLTLPAPHPYWGDIEETKREVRRLNEECARIVESQKSGQSPKVESNMDGLIIRIAEIEVHKKYLDEYLAAAHNVGATSVAQEEGVICIFPMQVKDKPTTIRIVEIYRDEAAYQAHLLTPHFLEYKQGTLHMVRKLRLVPVEALAPEAMPLIFEKLKK